MCIQIGWDHCACISPRSICMSACIHVGLSLNPRLDGSFPGMGGRSIDLWPSSRGWLRCLLLLFPWAIKPTAVGLGFGSWQESVRLELQYMGRGTQCIVAPLDILMDSPVLWVWALLLSSVCLCHSLYWGDYCCIVIYWHLRKLFQMMFTIIEEG